MSESMCCGHTHDSTEVGVTACMVPRGLRPGVGDMFVNNGSLTCYIMCNPFNCEGLKLGNG